MSAHQGPGPPEAINMGNLPVAPRVIEMFSFGSLPIGIRGQIFAFVEN